MIVINHVNKTLLESLTFKCERGPETKWLENYLSRLSHSLSFKITESTKCPSLKRAVGAEAVVGLRKGLL